jgi:hypothetical protein
VEHYRQGCVADGKEPRRDPNVLFIHRVWTGAACIRFLLPFHGLLDYYKIEYVH